MRGPVEAVLARVPEGRHVGIDRKAGFVAGDVQRHHTTARVLGHEPRRPQALRLRIVTQRAEDGPRLDARRAALPDHGLVHDLDDPIR